MPTLNTKVYLVIAPFSGTVFKRNPVSYISNGQNFSWRSLKLSKNLTKYNFMCIFMCIYEEIGGIKRILRIISLFWSILTVLL